MDGIVDLRSDVVTQPTDEMRKAMAQAEIGAYGIREDPTTQKLERLAAEMLGKEDALFFVTCTMANQVAVHIHTRPGDVYIVEQNAHLYVAEMGAAAALSGAQGRPIKGIRGLLTPEDVIEAVGPFGTIYPRATLLCVENTHNRAGGTVVNPFQMTQLKEVCNDYGLKMHLDGARLFNASVALGTDVRDLVKDADSVAFSLNKGLCAPVGAILAGSAGFIETALIIRHMYGGTWRQAGIVAAAGIIALKTMINRLVEDHQNARFLAEAIADTRSISIDPQSVQTNIVLFDIHSKTIDAEEFVSRLEHEGVLTTARNRTQVRMVTHRDVDRTGVERAINAVRRICQVDSKPQITR